MMHDLLHNPQVQAQLQKILIDLGMLVGSLAGILIAQAAKAVKESHMGVIQKMVAERVVKYVEQTVERPGPEKMDYVIAHLKEEFPKLDEVTLRQLAEAAVKSMNDAAQGGTPT